MIPKPPEHVATINDAATLAAFCERMKARDWIAVDTEFLRESTYYPKLCLVQIADLEEIALIDVLAIDDLSALAELLADTRVRKVFHSAEQDLEVLSQRFGAMPAPLFDTQLAAVLVGQDDQMGYARLISALLGVDLPKDHTRTDWSKRPLPDGALEYAADDVRYLAVAFEAIRGELAELSRADWLDDDMIALADPSRFQVDTDRAWRRLKQWHRLDAPAQQTLAQLAAWREREAMASDRPRKWILADDALYDIARRRPRAVAELEAIRSIAAKTVARHGAALIDCVIAADAHGNAPLAPTPQPPTAAEKTLIKAGMDCLAERAAALNIAASAIGSRKEIAAIVDGHTDTRLLSGWRGQAAGDYVLATIENARAGQPTGTNSGVR